jgi:hypothetical protein
MKDGNDLDGLPSPVHDPVLVDAEEENIQVGQVRTPMALAGSICQTLEGMQQFGLNAVGDCQPSLAEQVTPNLFEVFGVRRYEIGFHEPERSASHVALSASRRLRRSSPAIPFASVELSQTALDLGVDGFFVFLKPRLALLLYFQGIEEYVFYALACAAVQPLLNERFNFRALYFDGHDSALLLLNCTSDGDIIAVVSPSLIHPPSGDVDFFPVL